MKNKEMLTVIAVILIGILFVLAAQTYRSEQPPQTIGESLDKVINNVQDDANELEEEIKDEIDDHTTDQR